MWTLVNKIILQIGLGTVGTILEHAEFFGMKTWGIKHGRSFQPNCQKTFDLKNYTHFTRSSNTFYSITIEIKKTI